MWLVLCFFQDEASSTVLNATKRKQEGQKVENCSIVKV